VTAWLSLNLQEDLERLRSKIYLPTISTTDPEDHERRLRVVSIGSTVPGLRLCESRRIILLAQSAPSVDLAILHETLRYLDDSFNAMWPSITDKHERIIAACRRRLTDLGTFADHLKQVYSRREEAARLLESLLDVTSSGTLVDFQPVYSYVGYEVQALLPALKVATY
jgi:hypothetical protein